MKAKAFVSCLIAGSWLFACGSEAPPDEPPDPSDSEDDVVVIATAEAVTNSAATSGAGGSGSTAGSGSGPSSTSGGSLSGAGDRTSSAATTASADGGGAATDGASTSDPAATDTGTTGEAGAGAGGAAGAASGAVGGSGATAGDDASSGSGETGTSGEPDGSDGAGVAGSAGPSSTGEPPPPPPVPLGAVLITEYVEGIDGDDKAVELSNLSDDTVSLTACRLETYFNGKLESSSGTDLTIELRPQTSYVLCKSSTDSVLSSLCDRAAASINFNGDDALVLRCDGVVHDSFGQVGFDPGSEWRSPDGGGASADHIMRRRCGATPRTDPLAPFDEVFGADWVSVWAFADGDANSAYEGLGLATCAEPSAGSGGAAAE